jgi:predicted nucleotidyltransferase
LDLIAHWASRFDCIKAAVIYGSVARGDENQNSDLDVDLTYSDLSAPGMTELVRTSRSTSCARTFYARQVTLFALAIMRTTNTITFRETRSRMEQKSAFVGKLASL